MSALHHPPKIDGNFLLQYQFKSGLAEDKQPITHTVILNPNPDSPLLGFLIAQTDEEPCMRRLALLTRDKNTLSEALRRQSINRIGNEELPSGISDFIDKAHKIGRISQISQDVQLWSFNNIVPPKNQEGKFDPDFTEKLEPKLRAFKDAQLLTGGELDDTILLAVESALLGQLHTPSLIALDRALSRHAGIRAAPYLG